MKNTLSKILLTTILAFTITGCDKSNSNSESGEHIHRYDLENVEWFWKQLQNKDYEARATFSCLDCKEGTEGHSITEPAEVSKETTRVATCSQDGEYKYTASVTFQGQKFSDVKTREYSDATAHHYVEAKEEQYLVSPATCEDDAVYYKSCEHCHQASEETFVDVGSKLGHDLEHHDAQESTCQEHGHKEYYQCRRCQKYFLTPDGEAVGYNQIELPLSHKMTYHPGTEATCTTDGYLGYYTCQYEPGVKYYDEAGERVVASDDDLYVAALGHEFGENGHCIRCDRLLKDEYGLADSSLEDTVAPISLEDLGINEGTSVPTGNSHIFRTYDFVGNKGIDLWLKYSFEVVSGDTQFAVYLFNQQDESGVRFRIETNRTENDGIQYGYFIYNGATQVIFPITAKIKSGEEITVHIFAYLLDATTNTFRVGYQAGVDKVYNPALGAGGTGYETNTPLFTRDVELGSSFFNNNQHNYVRFSAVNNSSVVIKNASCPDKKIVLQNEEGSILGVKTFETSTDFNLPSLYKENNQFLGWFDAKGNKYSSLLVDGTYYLTARFVAKQSSMFVPSDAGFNTKGNWLSLTSSTPLEQYNELPLSSTSERNDVYFILDAITRTGADPYIVFGFPYDATDELTRVHLRINFNQNVHTLQGYFYGNSHNSLGEAGSSNYFSNSDVAIDNYKLLVHLYAISTVAGGLTFTVGAEIINLGTGASYSLEKQITSTVNFSTADRSRNMLCFKGVENAVGSEFRVTDAF